MAQPPLGASGCPTRRGGRPPPNNAIDITEESRGGGPPSLQHLLIVLGNRIISASKRAYLKHPPQNHLIKTLAIAASVGLASLLHSPVESTALTHQHSLTCVYAVSQRDFSFEFRLRDALSRMIFVIRDSHTTSQTLDSAMRLGEKAAPPRTPEQLAELGKYSGRSLQAG